MSLLRSFRTLARSGADLREAERLLRGEARRRRPSTDGLTTAERARRQRAEWAELHGLDVTHELAQEVRLARWLGWDICPPPHEEEEE
jgi:hypothetical protein